jgi:urea transport system permease protein
MDEMMLTLRRLLRFLLALIVVLAPAASARASALDDALVKFAGDSYSATEAAINAVAASGDPRALDIITALKDGKLYFVPDGKTYIKTASGYLDAATGEAVSPDPAGAKKVRVNNRIRNAIAAALGQLDLMSSDPASRIAAAEAIFRSRDIAALPALEAAIAAEQDPAIKRIQLQARAAVILTMPGAGEADMLEAVDVIRDRGDQNALALLGGLPPTAPAAVLDAAAKAIGIINGELAVWAVAQNAWYGLSLGSVLLLAAIGLAITFGVMGVINMAHGEMVMLGAYTTFVVQEALRTNAPWLFDWSLAIALPLAFLVAGAVGVVIERGIIRFLYGRPLETLLATWGLSLILQQAVRTIFGPNNRQVGNPSWMSGATDLGNLTVTYNRFWIIIFAVGVFVLLLAVLRFTTFGLQMRAVTQNRAMASAMGIRTPWVDALTFGLGSGIAGIAGVALSQIDNVSPNLGQGYIIDSFMVVVFGGVGNLWGTLLGAFSLGIANKFLEPFAGAVLGKIAVLVFIILFIQRRPRGLFALKGRAVEA